jgi:hypothetical protein
LIIQWVSRHFDEQRGLEQDTDSRAKPGSNQITHDPLAPPWHHRRTRASFLALLAQKNWKATGKLCAMGKILHAQQARCSLRRSHQYWPSVPRRLAMRSHQRKITIPSNR